MNLKNKFGVSICVIEQREAFCPKLSDQNNWLSISRYTDLLFSVQQMTDLQ